MNENFHGFGTFYERWFAVSARMVQTVINFLLCR